jgi:predicted dehydrogenase
MAERTAGIGVIGTGWWATQHHIPSLVSYERAELVALADPDADRLRAASDAFGVHAHADYRRLLERDEVEGVVVAVPHAYHYEIVRDALDAGKHVLVEKPMVLRARDAWDLVARAQASERHLTVGHTYHHTAHARRARELVASGRLGDLRLVSALLSSMVESFLRGRPDDYAAAHRFAIAAPHPRTYSDPEIAGGGQGYTQVCHAMGMVLWVTGQRVTEVAAMMESFDLPLDLSDAIGYRLEAGAIGTVASTGTLRPGQPSQRELRYYGSEGFLLQELALGKLAYHGNDGTVEEYPDLGADEIYPTGAPARELVDLILDRHPDEGASQAPGELGARTVEFLEAAYRSAADGRVSAT